MSNPFSSALNYLSGGHGGGGVSEGGSRFVGQTVDLGGKKKLKVKKVIAEGGYGYVFVAQDSQTGKDYALKRQVVSQENIKTVKREIAFLKQLGSHPHIIRYVASAGIPPSETSHGNAEFLIQTELCSGGQMEVVVRSAHLSPKQVLRVFYAACSAVAHMHSQQPPIIHRDIKVENLLLDSEGVIKLCDFGSATTQQLNPDPSWTATQRGLAEDEIQCNTTPMYRSPEMVDLYCNKAVNEKADVWALGCMLYLLCFRTHPFEDSGKLRIINANYKIPEEDTTFAIFHDIIRLCLVVDPSQRPTADALLAQLYNVSDQLQENMDAPSVDLLTLAQQSREPQPAESEGMPSERAASSSSMSSALQSTSQQAHKLFGFMKDGAGSLIKNIKESSSKALSAMAVSSPKKGGLDITYVTSRILAMSYPHDDVYHGHHLAEVKTFLDERHPSAYLVFNLSGNSYDVAKLSNQVYDFAWPQRGVPDMEKLVDLCRSMDAWLRADKQNVVVVHCHDGLTITPVAIVAYMLFIRAVSSPVVGLKYVAIKRRPESPKVAGTPSQIRYLEHMASLVRSPPFKPHPCKMTLNLLKLTTVPLFNAIRTGCKPFVEVYQEGERVYTSATDDTMDTIRSFHSDDGSVGVPLGVTVQGNICISVYHIRAIPVARKAGMGMTAVKMFYFQLHTGFLDPDQSSITLDRKKIDGSSIKKQEKFPSPFQAILEVEWDRSASGVYREASWQNLPYPKASPLTCFFTMTEQEEVFKQLDPTKAALVSRRLPHVPVTSPTSPPPANILLPSLNPSYEEESASAGGGKLFTLSSSPVPPPESNGTSHASNAGQDFFAQLDWQEKQQSSSPAGYVPYEDKIPEDFESASDSDSDSSSDGESSDEFDMFSAPVRPGGGGGSSNTGAGESLLIGNFETGASTAQSTTAAPQIKLIEFGAESSSEPPATATTTSNTAQAPTSSTTSTPYVDPFQEKPPAQGSKPSSSDPFGVVFDPFGGLSSTANTATTEPSSNADSAFGDLLGFGAHSSQPTPSSTTSPSSQPLEPTTSAASKGPGDASAGISSGGEDFFDPFGNVGLNHTPTLMPTATAATPHGFHSGHRHSEPFTDPASVMPPSMLAPQAGSGVGRKLSSPDQVLGQRQPPHIPSNKLSASFSHTSSVSHSHPNLASFGVGNSFSSSPAHRQGGWGTGGFGGSVSHNTSPRRSPSPLPQSSSTGNISKPAPAQPDPFQQFNLQDLTGTGNGTKVSSVRQPATTTSAPGHSKPPTGNSYQPYYMQSQARNGTQSQQQSQSQSNSSRPGSGTGLGPKPKPASVFQARPQSPNYNPSLFSNPSNKTGIPSKPKNDAFGDLLGNFSSTKNTSKASLKDMQSKNAVENSLDPDRAKVAAWADRKERNIRAILSSLHEILWEEESRWQQVGMHQLVQPDQVKKFYRKACLSVHPDKLQDPKYENLARAIFDELNDSYTKFEESGARPLY